MLYIAGHRRECSQIGVALKGLTELQHILRDYFGGFIYKVGLLKSHKRPLTKRAKTNLKCQHLRKTEHSNKNKQNICINKFLT